MEHPQGGPAKDSVADHPASMTGEIQKQNLTGSDGPQRRRQVPLAGGHLRVLGSLAAAQGEALRMEEGEALAAMEAVTTWDGGQAQIWMPRSWRGDG